MKRVIHYAYAGVMLDSEILTHMYFASDDVIFAVMLDIPILSLDIINKEAHTSDWKSTGVR